MNLRDQWLFATETETRPFSPGMALVIVASVLVLLGILALKFRHRLKLALRYLHGLTGQKGTTVTDLSYLQQKPELEAEGKVMYELKPQVLRHEMSEFCVAEIGAEDTPGAVRLQKLSGQGYPQELEVPSNLS